MDYEATKAARASVAAALQAANPQLVPIGAKVDGLQAAAKNLRIELKAAFPGITFSVKTRRFSGGDAMDVRWTDGPTEDQVDELVCRYRAGSFDGMTDSYTYEHNAWRDAFGDAKYTSVNRLSSDAAVAAAIRRVFTRYEGNLSGMERPSVEDFRSGRLYNVAVPGLTAGFYHDGLEALIRRSLTRHTFAMRAKSTVAPAAEAVAA